MEALLAKMSKQMEKMTKTMSGISGRISAGVAEAVAPISARIDANSIRMDKMEKRQREMNAGMEEKITKAINARMGTKEDMQKSGSEENAQKKDHSSYAGVTSAGTTGKTSNKIQIVDKADASWYWEPRRCLRFFPIPGKNDAQIRNSLDDFFANKLKVPNGDIINEDIKYIRRMRSIKKSRVQDEVIVAFTSVAARDLVQSHARNLAEYVGTGGMPLAGIRMEVPERLMSDFKALERYGHAMCEKHGNELKRNIKMDDSAMCLYLDIYLP